MIKNKIQDLLKASQLQAIFISGDWIDPLLFNEMKKECNKQEIFLSKLYFNDEAGCIVAVDDYNKFAYEILNTSIKNLNKNSKNEKKNTQKNLFSWLYQYTYHSWKKFGKESSQKLKEFQEEHEIMMRSAKNLEIEFHQHPNDMLVKNPVYPTLFNRFWKIEHRRNYLNYFFDKK